MDTGFDLVEEIPSADAQTQLGIEVYLTVKKKKLLVKECIEWFFLL